MINKKSGNIDIRPTVEITKPQKSSTATEADANPSKVDTPASNRVVGFVHPKHDDDADEVEVKETPEQIHESEKESTIKVRDYIET